LLGDPTKAKEKLGWVASYSLRDLVKDMMESDLVLMKKDKYLKDGGYQIQSYYE
jgi:GDPmannose 4,6-dehydratase